MASITNLSSTQLGAAQTEGKADQIDCGQSLVSKSTFVTQLGKRLKSNCQKAQVDDDAAFAAVPCPQGKKRNNKRAKLDSNVSGGQDARKQSAGNLIQLNVGPNLGRAVQSAPTSFNGSTTANPILDIKVDLPLDVDVDSDGSMDRRERR